jgi:hypothetical protein
VTWEEFARAAARMAGISDAGIVPDRSTHRRCPRRAPYYSVLGSERAVLAPPLDHALARYFRHRVPTDDDRDCACADGAAERESVGAGV